MYRNTCDATFTPRVQVATRCSRTLHCNLLQRVISAPLSFFESTPTGRILNRFANDMDKIDSQIPQTLTSYLTTVTVCVGTLLVAVVTPWFLAFIIPLSYVYYRIQRFYRATSRELKRLDSISRSPIFVHFSETLNGLSTIRAFGALGRFRLLNEDKVTNHFGFLTCVVVVVVLPHTLHSYLSFPSSCLSSFLLSPRTRALIDT